MSFKEKVVYLLGAGFSAPLGLPVMSSFLSKSKDLHASDPERYKHFQEVFKTIKDLSVVKNYYAADLFNIEEILSLLEMQSAVEGRPLEEVFLQYVKDVIEACMPKFTPRVKPWPNNWWVELYSELQSYRSYGIFVASLLGLQAQIPDGTVMLHLTPSSTSLVEYSVVTLNYDTVLEDIAALPSKGKTYISNGDKPIRFLRPPITKQGSGVFLAKLHGSTDSGIIIPPTWNKTLREKVQPEWKLAHDVLANANHIRVIGYSLPETDSYVKYLLRAAAISTPHLKSFDVISRDSSGSVKSRYDRFVDFTPYRFVKADVGEYLNVLDQVTMREMPKEREQKLSRIREGGRPADPAFTLRISSLEEAHETFFRKIHPN